jgi:hypothetical protein
MRIWFVVSSVFGISPPRTQLVLSCLVLCLVLGRKEQQGITNDSKAKLNEQQAATTDSVGINPSN